MSLINRKLGSYVLQEEISVGERATLFRAVNPRPNGGEFSIRLLHDPNDPIDERLLRHEYHSLQALKGRFTPKVIGIYRGEGALVCEWTNGISLQDLIDGHLNKRVNLNAKSAVEIICQLATSLQELHSHPEAKRPPIFGRLNPNHVLLTISGNTILLGMGRRLYNSEHHYRSPEQAAVAFIDWRTDQWSLGALMVELLLQEKLYDNRSDIQSALLEGNVSHWTKAIGIRWPLLGPIITKMLNPHAGDRYQNERQLIRELRNCHHQLEGRVMCRAMCETLIQYPNHPQNIPTLPIDVPGLHLSMEASQAPSISPPEYRSRQTVQKVDSELEPIPLQPSQRYKNTPAPEPQPQPQPQPQATVQSQTIYSDVEETEIDGNVQTTIYPAPKAKSADIEWEDASEDGFTDWDVALPTAESDRNSEEYSFDDIEGEEIIPTIPPLLLHFIHAVLLIDSLLAVLIMLQILSNAF